MPEGLNALSKEAKSERKEHQSSILEDLKSRMIFIERRANECCSEVGSSNWLTALPLEEKGFYLTIHKFCDAIILPLCYNWPNSHLPSRYASGSSFDISHVFSCRREDS